MPDQALFAGISDEDVAAFCASGQFDESWYLSEYPDVAKTGIDPARHYLWIGHKLGRRPSGAASPYVNEMSLDAGSSTTPPNETQTGNDFASALDESDLRLNDSRWSVSNEAAAGPESIAGGQPTQNAPDQKSMYDLVSAYFDIDYYLAKYPDVANSMADPVTHYLQNGEREGRSPNRSFNPKEYLQINPDVANIGTPPFVHYLLHGRNEGRVTMLATARPVERFRPKAPSMRDFAILSMRPSQSHNRKPEATTIVDVIVPVYRGYDDTLACIHSLLVDDVQTPREIIVINDCSPEPALAERLRVLAELGLFTLLENDENLGFVATVNRGMMLHPDRDVVLLNSDTEVYSDWLDRIVAHTQKERVASVTPLSNNATICSYPKFGADNPVPLEITYGQLDRLAADLNLGKSVKVPTGVGFCMFIPRKALSKIGLFNVEDFAKGYGEENDFCMRAAKTGWSNLLALDVFVRHTGETSFADTASESQKKGLEAVTRLHPDYLDAVGRFMRQDPARSFRQELDIERLKGAVPARERTLCFAHNWGGGIQRYLSDRAVTEQEAGKGLIICQPEIMPDGSLHLRLNAVERLILDNLDFAAGVLNRNSEFLNALKALGISKMEIHSLIGWPLAAISQIPSLAKELSVPYEFVLHDFTPVCPQINLTDSSDMYCGERGISQCNDCVRSKRDPSQLIHPRSLLAAGKQGGTIDVTAWRQIYGELLLGASRVVAPSADTATRFMRYNPKLQVDVVPHDEVLPEPETQVTFPYAGKGKIRVGIIGAIGPHKGANVLLNLAQQAMNDGIQIEYVVIGYTNNDPQLKSLGNVEITGPYIETDVFDIIRERRCNIAFLPSVWPETHCYTLSIAVTAGIPTIVFDIGAQAERAKHYKNVKVVPLSIASNAPELNSVLAQWALEWAQI